MENFKKLFGIENKKMPSTKEFLLGLFGLVALEASAQNEVHKHYSANEINTLKSQAKEIIDQLKAGTDSTMVNGTKLIWEIKETRAKDKIVSITEKRKGGEVVAFTDGGEFTSSTNSGYRSTPSNGFPLINMEGGQLTNDTVATTQGGLERTVGDFTENSFDDQRILIIPADNNLDNAQSISLSNKEAKDFVGGYVAQYKGDLAIIKSIQTRN